MVLSKSSVTLETVPIPPSWNIVPLISGCSSKSLSRHFPVNEVRQYPQIFCFAVEFVFAFERAMYDVLRMQTNSNNTAVTGAVRSWAAVQLLYPCSLLGRAVCSQIQAELPLSKEEQK